MIKRTLGPCKPNVKETAYNMLVRPKLEYASPIWNPHTTTQIKHLEKVQTVQPDFLKTIEPQKATTDLIATLGWPTLERRRIIKQAMTFYKKFLKNIINITPPPGPTKTIKKWPFMPPGAASTLQCSPFSPVQFASGT
ncbi:hypothetical protein NP493_2577g00002 [Ridgeia piscesae]|uniref:Uncharacterized protein n=1 Tax=Ridgeia piscesae TaxID=27915 RepID=A0AAD9MVS1_RIDPI|nr:hypothetical protein NP493_2577g00002 [Ridgeia piscesae]